MQEAFACLEADKRPDVVNVTIAELEADLTSQIVAVETNDTLAEERIAR